MLAAVDFLVAFFSTSATSTTSASLLSTLASFFAAALAADFLLARLRAPFGDIAITLNPHLKTNSW